MVSETTKETWGKVYEMNVYTFFNILAYTIDKRAELNKMSNGKHTV